MQQILLNALISGSTYALVGLGFGLVLFTRRFFHVAHGGVISVAAYLCWALATAGLPLLVVTPRRAALAQEAGPGQAYGWSLTLSIALGIGRPGRSMPSSGSSLRGSRSGRSLGFGGRWRRSGGTPRPPGWCGTR